MELFILAAIFAKFGIVISNLCYWISNTTRISCVNEVGRNCSETYKKQCICNSEVKPNWRCVYLNIQSRFAITSERKRCEPYNCLSIGNWCPWAPWSGWSSSCNFGQRFRTRKCCKRNTTISLFDNCIETYTYVKDNKDIDYRHEMCGFIHMDHIGNRNYKKYDFPFENYNKVDNDYDNTHNIRIAVIFMALFMLISFCGLLIHLKLRKRCYSTRPVMYPRNIVQSEPHREIACESSFLSRDVATGPSCTNQINLMDPPPPYGKVIKEATLNLPPFPPPSYESIQKRTFVD